MAMRAIVLAWRHKNVYYNFSIVSAPLEVGTFFISHRKEFKMSNKIQFAVKLRERAGKGASRALRRADEIPAVVYGDKKSPTLICVEKKELVKNIHKEGFFSKIIELTVSGKKQLVLAKDLQLHPVTDTPLHVDFLRIGDSSEVTVDVPLHFINEESCKGIKQGGILNVIAHSLSLVCAVDKLPSAINIDLSGLDLGDSIHLADIKLPDGSKSAQEQNITIASISAPSSMTSSDESDEESEESEENSESDS